MLLDLLHIEPRKTPMNLSCSNFVAVAMYVLHFQVLVQKYLIKVVNLKSIKLRGSSV